MKKDWILFICWPMIASALSLSIEASFLTSIMLYYGVPSLYLSIKNRSFISKSLTFALACLPLFLVIDYVAMRSGSWFFPSSIFKMRLFGATIFEVIPAVILYLYFVVMFYEYFLDKKCNMKKTQGIFKILSVAVFTLFLIFVSIVSVRTWFFEVEYFYTLLGIVFAVTPIIIALCKFPTLYKKLAIATAYFSFSSLLWEIVALRLHQWTFPGHYFIGWIGMFGVRFPLEEFVIWVILGAAATLSWYELLDDDKR